MCPLARYILLFAFHRTRLKLRNAVESCQSPWGRRLLCLPSAQRSSVKTFPTLLALRNRNRTANCQFPEDLFMPSCLPFTLHCQPLVVYFCTALGFPACTLILNSPFPPPVPLTLMLPHGLTQGMRLTPRLVCMDLQSFPISQSTVGIQVAPDTVFGPLYTVGMLAWRQAMSMVEMPIPRYTLS